MGTFTQNLQSKLAVLRLKSLLIITVLLAALAGVSACSFKPLYGTTATNAGLQEVLKTIEVVEVPGRPGQVIRFTGGGHASEPQYKLVMVVRESVTSQLVRRDGDSQGQFYELTTQFKLYSRKNDKEPILQGVSLAKAAFRDNTSVYSNVRSRRDAENRAAKTTAEDLQVRISAFLSGNS